MLMKTRIAITTDSAADITKPTAKEYDLHVIPMNILIAESQYKDGIDITVRQMLEKSEESKSVPKATAVSAQEYKLVFTSLVKKGYEVIHICPSGKLFPCYENASFAANSFENVHVIDSLTVSAGLALLCLEASRLRLEDKTADEIVSGIEKLKTQIDTSFLAADTNLLFKSGKCTALDKTGAHLFGFYPCVAIKDGALSVGEKHKGSLDAARKKYLGQRLEHLGEASSECLIFCSSGLGKEETDNLCAYIKEISPAKLVTVCESGCCIASYCSTGFIGLSFKKQL